MSDLREAVRRRLGLQYLDPRRIEEIVSELGDHVDDLVEEQLRKGATTEEATRNVLDSISDWDELRLNIQSAEQEEDIMNDRIKVLWLPVAGATVVFVALFQLFQPWLPKPNVTWALHGAAATFGAYHLEFLVLNWQWLLCLPVVGAFAGYWSRRTGGTAIQQALAASCPGVGLCCFLSILLSAVFVHDLPQSFSIPFMTVASLSILVWGVLPAFALLLGALPILKRSPQEPRREAAFS